MITWTDIEDDLDFEAILDELGIDLLKANHKGWIDTSCPLPSHPGADKNPSFGVNEHTHTFFCFTCDEGGNLAKLWSLVRDVSQEQACGEIAKLCGINTDPSDEGAEIQSIQDWIDKTFGKLKDEVPMRERRVDLPYFDPGAVTDLPFATLALLSKWGIERYTTIRALDIRYDMRHTRFGYTGPALIIPHWVDDQLVGWQERWTLDAAPKRWSNSSDFPKEYTLYNYDRAKALAEPTVVVEAAMTVARLHDLDLSAVATFGAALLAPQLKMLAELPELWLAFDNDKAGQKALRKARAYLADRTQVYIIPAPKHVKGDLADLATEPLLDLIRRRRHHLEFNGA